MLSSSHLIRLPYTSDLTEGGIAYALRSLTYTYDRAGGSPYDKLRRLVANTAVELAFRRYLSQQGIPFEVQTAMPFTDSERYDVSIDGRRCDVKSYFISYREQALEMRRTPEILLKVPALVPSDQHAREGHRRDDLYLFAFLGGLIAASQDDLKKAMSANQPHYLAYVMPEEWRKPLNWNPLDTLTLKSDSEEELLVEVNGQDAGREGIRRVVSLPPKTKVSLTDSFYSITALHVRRVPEARIGLRCENIKEALVVSPLGWGNLWIYGMDIFLAGYLSYEEFGQRAKPLLPNSRTFQYEHTKVKNLALPVSSLKPLQDLLGRA
ncbi:MAG: hypothetical protein U0Z26_07350 [Anaerolineales bacterium]